VSFPRPIQPVASPAEGPASRSLTQDSRGKPGRRGAPLAREEANLPSRIAAVAGYSRGDKAQLSSTTQPAVMHRRTGVATSLGTLVYLAIQIRQNAAVQMRNVRALELSALDESARHGAESHRPSRQHLVGPEPAVLYSRRSVYGSVSVAV
jgi:hypothetical protein